MTGGGRACALVVVFYVAFWAALAGAVVAALDQAWVPFGLTAGAAVAALAGMVAALIRR